MAAPKWFETTTYFNNKLAQMQRDEPEANWTADSLTAAFEKGSYNVNSADSMYTHFEQYGNTATERVSPNQYFDNDYYMNSKLAQMQATNPGYTMAQLETAMFSEGNMSPWTHYTLYGITEGIDPSAGFNTKEYMAAKLAQMQAEYPDENWTMDSLFEAFRAGNLNPIEHYFEYGVNENLAYTPVTPTEYNDIALAAGEHEYVGTAGDDNFMASVVSSSSKSTLQNDDSIDGAGGNDMLTVDMGANWNGFSDKGGMTNVETVNLNNSGSRAYTFDATGIEGAQTYNIDGNVSLDNLARAGVAVNLSNVDTSQNIEIGFADGVMSGSNDTLNIGMNNVRASGGITTNGIENIVINATGEASSAPLKYMQGSTHLTITGDGNVSFGNVSATMKNVDMSEATGDNFVCTRRADQIESVKLGQGDDRVSIRSIIPDAAIDGGEGVDTVSLVSTAGAYQFRMNDVETIAINVKDNFPDQIKDIGSPDPSESLILDGALTTGLETIKLAGGNGYDLDTGTAIAARPITLVNYDMGELGVDVTGKNNVNLTVTDVEDVVLTVGDGDATTIDSIQGSVTLADARSVAVNVADTAKATFSAALNAANAESLNLSNSQSSTLNVTGGDLSAVSQLKVGGYGDVSVAGNIGTDVGYVNVNAEDLVGGKFTSKFAGNSTSSGGATLNFTGSTTGENIITVDETYKSINITTGINDDKVILYGNGVKYTTQNLTGDLGYGNDVVEVFGKNVSGDFTGLKGVTKFDFKGMTTADVRAAIRNGDINIGAVEWKAYGGSVAPEDVVVIPGEQQIPSDTAPDAPVRIESNLESTQTSTIEGLPGQTNSYVGTISNSTTITGDTGAGAGVEVAFGTATEAADDSALNVTEVPELAIVGGTDASNPNSFTGAIDPTTNGAASTSITTGTTSDEVKLTVAQAAGQSTTIDATAGAATFDVEIAGAGETTVTSADFGDVIVAAAATGTTTLNSTAAADATVKVTTASSGETIVNTNAEAPTQTVKLAASGTGAVTINAADGQTVAVSGKMEAPDLVLNGNGGTFNANGSEMSGLENLTVSNGDTVIRDIVSTVEAFTLTTDSNTDFANAKMDSVKTITIKNTAEGDDQVVINGTPAGNDEGLPKIIGFRNVENVTVSGGDTELVAQLGSVGSTVTMTVEDDGSVTLGGAGLTGKSISYTNASATGVDNICANLASSESDASYDFNLGGGNDTLTLLTTQGRDFDMTKVANVSVDLGAGSDKLVIYGQEVDTTWPDTSWWGGQFAIEVNGFSISDGDKLCAGTAGDEDVAIDGSFADISSYVVGEKLTSAGATALSGFFDVLVANAGAILSSDSKAMIVDGDAYAVYQVNKNDGHDSRTVVINTVVKLVGVDDFGGGTIFGDDVSLE